MEEDEKDIIYLDFLQRVIPKKDAVSRKINKKNKTDHVLGKHKKIKASNYFSEITVVDSTTPAVNISDSLIYIETHLLADSINELDSLILKYPSLISLRVAVSENIEKNGNKKSENELLVERLRAKMQDYYKMKYPTPIHKFGENGRGVGISIPIDDIIELFK